MFGGCVSDWQQDHKEEASCACGARAAVQVRRGVQAED